MSVAKLSEGGTLDSMKSGDEPLDTVIGQTIGKEPHLSFSKTGESPVQWIQLLHAFDQQGTGKSTHRNALNGLYLVQKSNSLRNLFTFRSNFRRKKYLS